MVIKLQPLRMTLKVFRFLVRLIIHSNCLAKLRDFRVQVLGIPFETLNFEQENLCMYWSTIGFWVVNPIQTIHMSTYLYTGMINHKNCDFKVIFSSQEILV